jgi:uncharacterized protein (TIGR03084 family)
MLQQIQDLREEGDALYEFLQTLEEGDWGQVTPFKGWTITDVVQHLLWGDEWAVLSATDPEKYLKEFQKVAKTLLSGAGTKATTREVYGELQGEPLVARWRESFLKMCDVFASLPPDARLKWAGPDMGVRMFVTARQMETWAHAQDIYDLKKLERAHADRIKNIAVIGVKTFGLSFAIREMDVPQDIPYVRLTSPSGKIWEWNEPSDSNRVEGSAVDFCHVVTQGRNIADVNLALVGDTANSWMAIAQCFAGPPDNPPKRGERAFATSFSL